MLTALVGAWVVALVAMAGLLGLVMAVQGTASLVRGRLARRAAEPARMTDGLSGGLRTAGAGHRP